MAQCCLSSSKFQWKFIGYQERKVESADKLVALESTWKQAGKSKEHLDESIQLHQNKAKIVTVAN